MERKAIEQDSTQTSQALQAKIQKGHGTGRGRGRSCGGRGGRNRGRHNGEQNKDGESNEQSTCRGRGKPRGRGGRKNADRRNIQCFTCSKYDRYSSECWYNENAKKENNDEANLVKDEVESNYDQVVLMNVTAHGRNYDESRVAKRKQVQDANKDIDKCTKNVAEIEYVSLVGKTSHANEETSWYLDTGCSNDMTGNQNWLIDLDTSIKSTLITAP